MKKFTIVSMGILAIALVPAAISAMAPRAPVTKFTDPTFGSVLATPKKKALYYWSREKRAGGKLRCFGSCAKAWPPLIVKSRRVDPKVQGIKGRFGTIRRPDGRYQVTHNGLPVYSYAHERPRQVLCNNVDGWFVIKLR